MKRWLKSIIYVIFACILLGSGNICYGKGNTKTIYVVSKAEQKWKDMNNESFDKFTYKYNSDGMISTIKDYSVYLKDTFLWTFKYDGNKFTDARYYEGGAVSECHIFTYDGNGRVILSKIIKPDDSEYDNQYSYTYDNTGRCIQIKSFDEDSNDVTRLNYYKNGLLKKIGNVTYIYDKHKMISQKKEKGSKTIKFTNTYKKGRLVKRKNGKKYYTQIKYKYKKIKVPADKAAMIEAQQRWIIRNLADGDQALESVYK